MAKWLPEFNKKADMDTTLKQRLFGTLLILSGTILWGSAYVARKMAFDDIGPIMQNAARFFAGFCFMLLMTIIVLKRKRKEGKKGIPLSVQIRKGVIIGIVFSLSSVMQQTGLMMVDAGKSGFLSVMYVVLVPVIAFFCFRQTIGKQVWLGIILSMVGLMLLTGGISGFEIGYVFLIGGAAFISVQIILIDRFVADAEPIVLVTTQLAVGVVTNLIVAIIIREPFTIHMFYHAKWSILYSGILSLGVANVFQFASQKMLKPSVVAIMCSFESVFSMVFGMLILSERMTALQLLGSLLLLVAAIVSQLERKEPEGKDVYCQNG